MSEREYDGYGKGNKIDPRNVDYPHDGNFPEVDLIDIDTEDDYLALDKPPFSSKPRTRELTDVAVEAKKTQALASELLESITASLEGSGVIGLLARSMMGGEYQEVTKPDGSIEKTPWTLQDIFDHERENRPQYEKNTRQTLVREVAIGLDQQRAFFTTSEHPRLPEVESVIQFTAALMQRLLASEGSITEPFPWGDKPDAYSDAEMLEIMRRTLLKPHYMIMEGFAQGEIRTIPSYDEVSDFWEPSNERDAQVKALLKNPQDLEEYQKIQKHIALTNPRSYDNEEWENILDRQQVYLLEYAATFLTAATNKLARNMELLDLYTVNEQPLVSETTLLLLKEELGKLLKISSQFAEVTDFNKLLRKIQNQFGSDADYQTLFQAFKPMDLNHKPTFKDPY